MHLEEWKARESQEEKIKKEKKDFFYRKKIAILVRLKSFSSENLHNFAMLNRCEFIHTRSRQLNVPALTRHQNSHPHMYRKYIVKLFLFQMRKNPR